MLTVKVESYFTVNLYKLINVPTKSEHSSEYFQR